MMDKRLFSMVQFTLPKNSKITDARSGRGPQADERKEIRSSWLRKTQESARDTYSSTSRLRAMCYYAPSGQINIDPTRPPPLLREGGRLVRLNIDGVTASPDHGMMRSRPGPSIRCRHAGVKDLVPDLTQVYAQYASIERAPDQIHAGEGMASYPEYRLKLTAF